MNSKTYRVLKAVLKREKYISVSEVAFETNLTCRQVQSLISMLALPFIVTEYDSVHNVNRLMIIATPEEREATLRKATIEYYGISPDMMGKVHDSLSSTGWMSVFDIAEDTELYHMDVSKALSLMDDVVSKETGMGTLYRRCEQVL